ASSAAEAATQPGAAARSAWLRALPWAVAGIFGVAAVAALWSPWRSRPSLPAPRKLLVSIGVDASLPTSFGAPIVSPDGTTLAVVAQQAGGSRLFVRKLDQLQAIPLATTEGADNPFFSPDGQWIAFFARGKLKKVSVTGGAAVTLCDSADRLGGTWA